MYENFKTNLLKRGKPTRFLFDLVYGALSEADQASLRRAVELHLASRVKWDEIDKICAAAFEIEPSVL